MHAGRLGKICGLFRLCRLADSLAIALALGYAASAVAATETAVLDSPLMLTPPGAPQPNDPQLGGPQLGGPQLGDMQPAAGPWNDAASWSWQVLPGSLIYHSYLAGTKEPRFATQWFHDSHWGWTWDATLGARIGLLRYGSDDCQHPDGWQLDLEGAAFPRLDLEHQENVTSVDFRFGVPLTYGWGPYQAKFGYFHVCSHLGDEFMLMFPDVERINYVRNGINWGNSYYFTEDSRVRRGGLGLRVRRRRQAVGIPVRRRVQSGRADRLASGAVFRDQRRHTSGG